jgi:hypothetical protein
MMAPEGNSATMYGLLVCIVLLFCFDHRTTHLPACAGLPNLQQLASRELTRSEIETISQAVRRSSITVGTLAVYSSLVP